MTRILSETLAPPITAIIGRLRLAEQRVEDLQLLLDEEADRPVLRRELLGDGDHRGLVAVAGAEGVVDVGVGQPGQLGGEGGVALLLALVEPDVLQDEDLAGLEGCGERPSAAGPTVSSAFLTGLPMQLARAGPRPCRA